MTQAYPPGSAVVVAVLFAILWLTAFLEVLCEWNRWPSLSHKMERWADTHRWFSGGLLAIFFILLCHFVLNPLVLPDSCQCSPKSLIELAADLAR